MRMVQDMYDDSITAVRCAVKEDMAEVEVTEEDAEDRRNWRWKIRCGDP